MSGGCGLGRGWVTGPFDGPFESLRANGWGVGVSGWGGTGPFESLRANGKKARRGERGVRVGAGVGERGWGLGRGGWTDKWGGKRGAPAGGPGRFFWGLGWGWPLEIPAFAGTSGGGRP